MGTDRTAPGAAGGGTVHERETDRASAYGSQSLGMIRFFRHPACASASGTAALAACLLLTLSAACAGGWRAHAPHASAPGTCSWFGDAREGVLYFGESSFWHALREADGDARADLESRAPQQVGRFDLVRETPLPPLATGNPTSHSGTWDVLAHPNGRIYFTSFYDPSGWVDPATGATRRFDAAGTGLNEIALGPDGRLVVTRYGAADGGDGSVVVLDPEGTIAVEHPLAPSPGAVVAAKSVAWDAARAEVWVNTDVLPRDGAPARFDARVIDFVSGRELARVESPELHFPRFATDGRSYFAWLDGRRLVLRVTPAGERPGPGTGREILLDDAFGAGVDFVQEVRDQPDGRIVVTRWSGAVHVVELDGRVRRVTLPRRAGGFYYTAVATGERVCATYCAGVTVTCVPL